MARRKVTAPNIIRHKVKWDKVTIRQKLETDDAWLLRGVVAIYKRQTDEEQNTESTKVDNGVGFNGTDAALLSSFAKQIEERGFLTLNQIAWARKKMLKYSLQLAKIANGKL